MDSYIGSKIVKATPMSSHKFQQLVKGQKIVFGSDEPGYLVVYPDGHKSWSPADTFKNCYRLISKKEVELLNGTV